MISGPFLLDTDIASYLLRGGNRALDLKIRHAAPADIYISVITQAEMLYGVKHLPYRDTRREEVYWFLQLAQILDWNGAAAEAYADIRYRLALEAQPIGELDMMIAAHALSLDAVLVSNNTRHYERLSPPLRVENWTEA
jgi:tRNA(fMet)-specific endonuclease VapC